MPTKNYVDLTGLEHFKTKQDEYNLTKFASLSGGKVTAEQLPSYVDDIVEGYAVNNEGTITFYSDSEHTQEIAGETGKIYVDLAATIDGTYRYGGSVFVPVGNSVSTADKAVKDADGNDIAATYVKNSDKAGTYNSASDTGVFGVVTVGENITNTDGVISLNSSNVTGALGYTPLDSAEISAATTAQIDSLFE